MDQMQRVQLRKSWLSLRGKTLALVGLTLLVLIALTSGAWRLITLQGFDDLEQQNVIHATERAGRVLVNELNTLSSITGDWAYWDDTYQFVVDRNTAYVENNLDLAALEILKLNLFVIMDLEGTVAARQLRGIDSLPPDFEQKLAAAAQQMNLDTPGDQDLQGVEILGGIPTLITARFILNDQGEGPPRGLLIMGRSLDQQAIDDLSYVSQLEMSPGVYGDPDLPADYKTVQADLERGSHLATRILNEDTIAGYVLMRDVNGSPSLIMRVQMPRVMYHKGQDTAVYLLVVIAISAVVLIVVISLLLEYLVLRRMARLSAQIQRIGQTNDLAAHLPVRSSDELGQLAGTINGMLHTLQESRRTLITLMSNLPGMVYRCQNDPQWTMQFVSEGCLSLTGYTYDQLNNNHVVAYADLIHPDDRQPVWDEIQTAIQARRPFQLTYRIQTASGAEKWVWEQGRGVFDDTGQLLFLEGFIADITDRTQAEETLRENEERLARIVETVPDGITILSREGQITFANPAAERILGLTRRDITQRVYDDPAWKLTTVDGRPYPRDDLPFARVIRTGQAVYGAEHAIENQSGSRVILSINAAPLRDAAGEITGVLTALSDITQRFHAEEGLRQTQGELERRVEERTAELATERNLLRSLIDSLPDYIYIKDMQGRFITTNQAAVKATGLNSREELVGKTDFDFWPHDLAQLWSEGEAELLATGKPIISREEPIYKKDGTVDWILTTKIPLRDTTGQIIGLIGIGHNITQRKELEIALRKAHDELEQRVVERTLELADANAALRKANRAYRTLSDCNQVMVRATDETSLLTMICETVVNIGGYVMAWVGYTENDADQTVRPVAYAGYEDGYLNEIRLSWGDNSLSRGPSGQAIRSGQPHSVTDIEHDPDFAPWRDAALRRGYRSALSLPLVTNDQVFGSLAVYSTGLDAFNAEEIALLAELAGDLAFGIEALRTRLEREKAEAQLRENEARLRALIENTQDLIWSVDTDYRLITMNSAFKAHVLNTAGFEPMPGSKNTTHLPESLRTNLEQFYSRALAGEHFTVEVHYETLQDRLPFDREMSFSPIRAADGTPTGIVVFSRDISERKQAEAALRQLNTELTRRNRELLALHEAGRKLTTTLDTQEIYRIMYEEVALRLLGVPHFIVTLYDEAKRMLHAAFAVMDDEVIDTAMLPPVPLGEGPNSTTILTRQPRIVDFGQLLAEGRGRQTLIGSGDNPKSGLYVPLVSGDRALGVINLQSYEEGAFQDADVKLLSILANQGAIAIRNAQLFAAERDQRQLAEALSETAAAINRTLQFDEVVSRLLDALRYVVPHDAANIMLIEEGEAYIVHHQGYAERGLADWINQQRFVVKDVPVWQNMIETGQPFAITDTHLDEKWMLKDLPEERWIRSTVKAPILMEGQLIGILHADSATPGTFTQAHANRLKAFAEHAAIAIRNAQYYLAIQTQAAELEQHVKARTAELERQRVELQTVLDAMGESLIYVVNNRIVYVNRAFTQLFGWESGEVRQNSLAIYRQMFDAYLDEQEALARQIWTVLLHGQTWRGELKLRRKDGTTFDAAMTAAAARSFDEHEPPGAVYVIRDISEQKALHEQKDRFIANASHELRTPLANIKTRLYLAQKQPERFETHMAILERVANTMTELIESLLDVSRFDRGVILLKRRAVNLQGMVTEVVAVQQAEAEQHNVTLLSDIPDTPVWAYVDPQRMTQVFTNLLNNAINYTSEGGSVTVQLEQRPPSEDRPAGQAVIRFIDTGIGIPPDLLPHIFEPFFRVNERTSVGTGLGLTIAREIVNKHEGQLTVESKVGVGSVFCIELDLHQP